MSKLNKALIVVDFQRDFRKGGALEAERSEEILDPIIKLAQEVDYVVASGDQHPEDHVSFTDPPLYEDGSWPVHCVKGTPGAEIAPEILAVADAVVSKGTDKNVEQYSAFQGTVDGTQMDLAQWLLNHSVDHVYVAGLVDEFCVKRTAIDATEGFRVTVNVHTAAALTEEGEKQALRDMADAGIHISDRLPRGERDATREEALSEATTALIHEAHEAERSGNEDLAQWYHELIPWLRHYAGAHPEAFVVPYPDFCFSVINLLGIPEAEMSLVSDE